MVFNGREPMFVWMSIASADAMAMWMEIFSTIIDVLVVSGFFAVGQRVHIIPLTEEETEYVEKERDNLVLTSIHDCW